MSEPLKSCPFCGNGNVKLVLEHDEMLRQEASDG